MRSNLTIQNQKLNEEKENTYPERMPSSNDCPEKVAETMWTSSS